MKGLSHFFLPVFVWLSLASFSSVARAEVRLLMLDSQGCAYCEAWTAEVGDAYHKTSEGRIAPLLRQNIRDDLPQGVALKSAAVFTPTFILLDNGVEIGRITGYPGEDFFWWMLENMLDELPELETEAEGS